MNDILPDIVAGMAVYLLISMVALLHFQIERRDPIKGEWIWLGGLLPLVLMVVPAMWILSVVNRVLRGEGLHWRNPRHAPEADR